MYAYERVRECILYLPRRELASLHSTVLSLSEAPPVQPVSAIDGVGNQPLSQSVSQSVSQSLIGQ
jgi:hypothetical protein